MEYVIFDVKIAFLFPKRHQIDNDMQFDITDAYFMTQLNFALSYINLNVIYAKQVL